MSPTAQLEAFAQSVYLVIKNRYYDDITGTDGQVYIAQIIDWANQYLDELETETNPDGTPVDWNWERQMGFELGTAVTGATLIALPTSVKNLLTDQHRYLQISHDGIVVSNWVVVAPNNISNQTDRVTEDMVTVVGGNIIFSRPLKDTESGGLITADVMAPLPRLSLTNVKSLSLVKPKQLLILGVAKNATLPDIVQGGLSPSYAQKYDDLLTGAIARNNASGAGETVVYEDYSGIHGIGF